MNVSSYALSSADQVFSKLDSSLTPTKSTTTINNDETKLNQVATQSNSTPNPISPSVFLDISDTAKTKLKESTSMSN
jgi:hypothetical protein